MRQQTIQYLINEKDVPMIMIEVEVSMSYFYPKEKGRADIIVYAVEGNSQVRILVIECKSMKNPLIDNVYEQVYKYESLPLANTIAITNGIDFLLRLLLRKLIAFHL